MLQKRFIRRLLKNKALWWIIWFMVLKRVLILNVYICIYIYSLIDRKVKMIMVILCNSVLIDCNHLYNLRFILNQLKAVRVSVLIMLKRKNWFLVINGLVKSLEQYVRLVKVIQDLVKDHNISRLFKNLLLWENLLLPFQKYTLDIIKDSKLNYSNN